MVRRNQPDQLVIIQMLSRPLQEKNIATRPLVPGIITKNVRKIANLGTLGGSAIVFVGYYGQFLTGLTLKQTLDTNLKFPQM